MLVEECDRAASTVGKVKTGKEIGIDLGLKTVATLSDGNELSRENLTKKYEGKQAVAQRAGKKTGENHSC